MVCCLVLPDSVAFPKHVNFEKLILVVLGGVLLILWRTS